MYNKNHLNHNPHILKIHVSDCKHLYKYVPGTLLPLMIHSCLKTFEFLKKQLLWCEAEESQPGSGSPALRFVASGLPRPAGTQPLLNLSKAVLTLSPEQQHCDKQGDIHRWPHTCCRVFWKQRPGKAKSHQHLVNTPLWDWLKPSLAAKGPATTQQGWPCSWSSSVLALQC